MLTDLWTVIWKEFREFMQQRGSTRGTLLMIGIPVVILGLFFPLQMGRKWVEEPLSVIMVIWVQLFLVVAMIADSFAGERERHTLETLLASRLSDKVILFGKIGAAVGHALTITALTVLLGLVTVNLVHGKGKLLMFPLPIIFWGGLVCILIAFLMAGAGILVSLRSATVRQAHQTLSFSIILIVFLPSIISHILPQELTKTIGLFFSGVDTNVILMVVVTALILLDFILLYIAMAKFKREKMIGE